MATFTIKECPFCGVDSAILTAEPLISKEFYVCCQNCNGSGPKCDSSSFAIETWNFRFEDRITHEKLTTLILEGKWKSVEEWARTGVLP